MRSFDRNGKASGPRIGVQGSVMGWLDPWHPECSRTLMRTGEGRVLGPQDSSPSASEFVALLRTLGADFYLHHAMPGDSGIDRLIDDMAAAGLDFLLGNEYGNINGPFGETENRFDIPEAVAERAAATGRCLGLLYDETEHLQLHPSMYLDYHPGESGRNPRRHQWAAVDGLSLQESEDAVAEAVRRRVAGYGGGVDLWSEQVFPVMYHALARGGMNPCPKLLKEEFASVQVATALGAARQYGRKLGFCVDFWGQDVGDWFTRIWGFPGHSPAEYRSALELAYLMGPDLLFTENADVLARHTDAGFRLTEFGAVLEEFTQRFVPAHPLAYGHAQADPDVVLIRSDDTEWGLETHPYGNQALSFDYRSRTPFKVFSLMSRGRIPPNGLMTFLPQYTYHAGLWPRDDGTVKRLPLEQGVDPGLRTRTHRLFHPLPNLLVLDERAGGKALGDPGLIFLAGTRMTPDCLQAVADRVRGGATCVALRWLLPDGWDRDRKDGDGRWIVVEDLECDRVAEAAAPFLGEEGVWMQRFGDFEVRWTDAAGDGVTLRHEVTRVEGRSGTR